MKKIISITNVFIKEYYQSLPIFDTSKRKFNKRSLFFWLLAIIFFGVSYVSYDVIKFFIEIGQKEIFLNLFLPILFGFLAFQAILSCANIFFFSKDIVNVLYMPIKPEELLLAKFATQLCMLYVTEGLIMVVPIFLYGMLAGASFLYYIWAVLIILLIPIFVAAVIAVLTFIIMRLAKFIKNKETFQIISTIALIMIIFIAEFVIFKELIGVQTNDQPLESMISINERFYNVNRYFLIINPIIKILKNPAGFDAIIEIFKVIFWNIFSLFIFIIIGKLTYLKYILKNSVSIGKKHKINKKININKRIHSNKIAKTYILKELKLLVRQPVFFMQCLFPVISLLISCVILVIGVYPVVMKAMQDEELLNAINNFTINTEIICDILIILQVLFSISNISLTAISREGKNAIFIKFIPIELYKQFIYKNIPQFVTNLLITIVVLGLCWYILPSISFEYMLLTFAISTVINVINCYLMLIVDLRRPNLDWIIEDAVVKKSDNRLFQYSLMIVNILILLYIATIFKEINLVVALIIELIIYSFVFIVIDRCVKKWQGKLFNKIN